MVSLLAKWFIEDHKEYKKDSVRAAYGTLCSILGVFWNLILFGGKYFAGILSGSVAVTADSFNNLSDAASSVFMLFGFRLSSKQADADHPYGHGRMEYVTGMIIAFLVMFMGVELLRSSVDQILHPTAVTFNLLSGGILVGSVAVKLYMAAYNFSVSKKIGSSAVKAAATDSISDCCATGVVFVCMLISHFTGLALDGYCGALVSLLILYAGFSAVKETLGELLGKAPDPDFVKQIKETVLSHQEVVGIHDMLIHDYGPGRVLVSLHAEVPGDGDIYAMHDAIDHIEMELMEKYHCETTIHMDPVEVNNEKVDEMRKRLVSELKNVEEAITIHDFRMVVGPTHTNLIFDIALPVEYKKSELHLREQVESMVAEKFENTFAVFKIERVLF
ncbi:MAG: cation transporter [Clostridia bacterium]|nr:cation transporter [Clostridia bacterium]